MSLHISLRTPIPSDIPAIASLMTELGYPTVSVEMGSRMECFAANPDYRTLVAVNGGTVVGVIGMMKSWYWEQNGCYVKIQALVVNSTARKSGAGEILVAGAEEWARTIGASAIFLNCGNKPEREAAHRFYPRMGFEHRSSGYVKRLKD